MLGYDFWIQLVVVLIALFYGARKGGMALGLIGGIGLLVLVFGFGVKPGKPPVDVILTILAVVCGSAALQAAGGLDCLLQIAERVLRRHPPCGGLCGPVHLLVPDGALRYRPRRLHDAADYLRRSDQEQHSS